MENDTQIEVYQNQGVDVLKQAETIEVVDQDSYDVAGAFVKSIKPLEKGIVEYFKKPKKKTDEAHKEICDLEKKALKPVKAALTLFNGKMTMWYSEEQRRVQVKEDELRREAIRQQEEEKLKKAEELAESGDEEAAEEVLAEPIVEPVFKPQKVEKPKGISYRDNWKFRIVAESSIPRLYLMPDERMIGSIVRNDKDKTNIPGIEVYNARTQVVG